MHEFHEDTADAYRKYNLSEDIRKGRDQIFLTSGEYIISEDDVIIYTILGSCVSVCFYAEHSKLVGMNHFMLPESKAARRSPSGLGLDVTFYGIHTMELVINDLMKHGVMKKYLRAKVFGGGDILRITSNGKSVGEQNIDFALDFLQTESIPVTACSVGGQFARKVFFFTRSHEVYLHKLDRPTDTIITEETSLRKRSFLNTEVDFF